MRQLQPLNDYRTARRLVKYEKFSWQNNGHVICSENVPIYPYKPYLAFIDSLYCLKICVTVNVWVSLMFT